MPATVRLPAFAEPRALLRPDAAAVRTVPPQRLPNLRADPKQSGSAIMHTSELIELAAVVSAHGPALVRGSGRISTRCIERYWGLSKCRLARWNRSLNSFSVKAAGTDARRRLSGWPLVRGVLEEVLTSEVLTRVWTAVTAAYDRHHRTNLVEPVARSVLTGHLEARHRVLTLLARGPGIDGEEAVRLNRLRRRTERWTDMLVGYLTGLDAVSEFAVDPVRASDFAEDLRCRSRLEGGRGAWPLILASLRTTFGQGLGRLSPNADLNDKIAATILSCFQGELCSSIGIFQSLWMLRLTNAADDAQGMLDDLLASERSGCGKDVSAAVSAGDHLRRFDND